MGEVREMAVDHATFLDGSGVKRYGQNEVVMAISPEMVGSSASGKRMGEV